MFALLSLITKHVTHSYLISDKAEVYISIFRVYLLYTTREEHYQPKYDYALDEDDDDFRVFQQFYLKIIIYYEQLNYNMGSWR